MDLLTKIFLWKFSILYRIVVYFWHLYWNYARQVKLPAKVISIGNIAVGGTGKTPLVVYLANLVSKSGFKTAVAARGYKRKSKGLIEVNDKSKWETAGDEPIEIFRLTEGVRVYVCESKTEAAKKAASDGADVVIIDDGFQHQRLARDIDIVCLDRSKPLGPGGYLPLGLLREPVSSLKRADILVYTTSINNIDINADLEKFTLNASDFIALTRITGFTNVVSSKIMDIEYIRNHKVVAFCGLGSPEKFRNSLYDIDIKPVEILNFRDHHCYTLKDIEKIKKKTLEHNVSILITTLKDAVKIECFDFSGFELYYAMLDTEIVDESGRDRNEAFKTAAGL